MADGPDSDSGVQKLFGSRRENSFWVDPSLSKCIKIGDYVGDDKSHVLMYDS